MHLQRVESGHRRILCWGLAAAHSEIQGPQLAVITFAVVVSVKSCLSSLSLMIHRSTEECFGLVASFGDVRVNDLLVSTGTHQSEVWVTSKFHSSVTMVSRKPKALRVTAQFGHHFSTENAVYPSTAAVLRLVVGAQAPIIS